MFTLKMQNRGQYIIFQPWDSWTKIYENCSNIYNILAHTKTVDSDFRMLWLANLPPDIQNF